MDMSKDEFLKMCADAYDRNDIDNISDGYHTFGELYNHRASLFATICHLLPDAAWKSKMHDDGSMYDGMFICGITTPFGQATYHYDIDPWWDKFDCNELPKAPKFDGHSPEDARKRIYDYGMQIKKKNDYSKYEEIMKSNGKRF